MLFLYIVTGAALLASFLADTQKTFKAIKITKSKFLKILPSFFSMIMLVSVVLYFMPETMITKYLRGTNLYLSTISASLLGSISMLPGFIVFPLGGILVNKGTSYMVIAAFTTSLMMVGALTYPLEQKFLGTKITIIRNIVGYFISIVIAIIVGALYGEIF